MKTTRIKAPAILNRAAFDLTVDTIARATTRLRKLEAARDARVQEAQKTNADEIADVEQQIELAASMCEKYAEAHRDELLPSKAKSAETALARFGFRLGNRTVALLNRKCSWDAAVKLLKAFKIGDAVRVAEEVDKEFILRNAPAPEVTGTALTTLYHAGGEIPLEALGLKINQSETFFIEPKVEGADTVKAGGAS